MRSMAGRGMHSDPGSSGTLRRRRALRVPGRLVCGVPPPDADNYIADADLRLDLSADVLAALEADVERYGLLDDRVRFPSGWFKDALPTAPIDRISLPRLDGDLYESTIKALDALYPRLSPGGFCIIDDYHAIEACGRR